MTGSLVTILFFIIYWLIGKESEHAKLKKPVDRDPEPWMDEY